jgi:hypothetical protein
MGNEPYINNETLITTLASAIPPLHIDIQKQIVEAVENELFESDRKTLKKHSEQSLATSIENAILKYISPKNDTEAKDLTAQSFKLATEITKAENIRGSENTYMLFVTATGDSMRARVRDERDKNERYDYLPLAKSTDVHSGAPNDTATNNSLPISTMAGGAIAGLATAAMADVGDWTSIGGIIKKLGLITVAIAAGSAIGAIVGGDVDLGKLKDRLPQLNKSSNKPGDHSL